MSDPSPELQPSTTTYLLDISCRIFHWIVTQHIPDQTPHSSIPTHTQNSLPISVYNNLSLQSPSPSTGKSVTLDLFSHGSCGKSYWSQLQNKSRIWRPHHFLFHSPIHHLSNGLLQLLQTGPSFSTCLCNMGYSWHRDRGDLFTWKFHHLSFLLTTWWSLSALNKSYTSSLTWLSAVPLATSSTPVHPHHWRPPYSLDMLSRCPLQGLFLWFFLLDTLPSDSLMAPFLLSLRSLLKYHYITETHSWALKKELPPPTSPGNFFPLTLLYCSS